MTFELSADNRAQYDASRARIQQTLEASEIAAPQLDTIATELFERRHEDLSGLTATEQAALITDNTHQVLPQESLLDRLRASKETDTPLRVKYGIDPTGADVHLGHAVPMVLLSRLQRMGHTVTFIVGDFTAKIGDPSGRVQSRPVLTDEDIAHNMATYVEQVRPLFDVDAAQVYNNGNWLNNYPLSKLMAVFSQVQVSALMQRRDFRTRIEAGSGITQAELMYPVIMALDSVELESDIEIGGKDQFLNMQMGRTVMAICGHEPEVIVTTDILQGTDGSGSKMSKSLGNYVALKDAPDEIHGKIMSIPDALMQQYFGMLTELDPAEWQRLDALMQQRRLNPMRVKELLAGDIVSALHSQAEAANARQAFSNRFSRQDFAAAAQSLPDAAGSLTERVMMARGVGHSAFRRLVQQGGVQIIGPDGEKTKLTTTEQLEGLAQPPNKFIKVGRLILAIPEE